MPASTTGYWHPSKSLIFIDIPILIFFFYLKIKYERKHHQVVSWGNPFTHGMQLPRHKADELGPSNSLIPLTNPTAERINSPFPENGKGWGNKSDLIPQTATPPDPRPPPIHTVESPTNNKPFWDTTLLRAKTNISSVESAVGDSPRSVNPTTVAPPLATRERVTIS